MKSKVLVVVMVAALALVVTGFFGTKVTHAAAVTTYPGKVHSPSPTANVAYVTFPKELGPYCVAAQRPSGAFVIFNGVATVSWRYNYASGGYDRLSVNGGTWIAINPKGIHKLATGNCFFYVS